VPDELDQLLSEKGQGGDRDKESTHRPPSGTIESPVSRSPVILTEMSTNDVAALLGTGARMHGPR